MEYAKIQALVKLSDKRRHYEEKLEKINDILKSKELGEAPEIIVHIIPEYGGVVGIKDEDIVIHLAEVARHLYQDKLDDVTKQLEEAESKL